MTHHPHSARSRIFAPVLGLLLLAGVAFSSTEAHAQGDGGPFGLGIILGEPTGLTAKLWLARDAHALDFHLAWDFSDEDFAIFVDYLFHLQPWNSPSPRFELPLYVGIGAKLGFDADDDPPDRDDDADVTLGIRIPVGVAFLFERVPVEAFIEIAPGLRLIPRTAADIDAGIGARFYF